MEPVGKHFGGLVGAVEVRVAPRYGIGHTAHVCVHVQPQHRACEITEKLEDGISAFCLPELNVVTLLYESKYHPLIRDIIIKVPSCIWWKMK